jgi:hypothetical protein
MAYGHAMKADPRLTPSTRPGPPPGWFRHHAIGLLTLLIGLVGFIVVAISQQTFWSQPDWRLSVPFLVAAVAAGAVSLARREGAVYLPLLGIGLAAAAMVLGFVLVFGAVVLVTALVILILSGVM